MYEWIFIVGLFFAFYNAWGIGANDCANSFATSVGSKALTLKQAIIIASIFEFSGAVLLGSLVTDTVRKKIVDIDIYNDNPYALMYGMLCADLASAIWLTVATYFRYPVSTTHSIIGAIVGFSLAYGGSNAIVWKKIGFIVLSWLVSPLLAGIFSAVFFYLINTIVFNSTNPYENTSKLFPIITFLTFFINALFIIYKGSPQLDLDELPLWIAIVSSLSIGLVTSLIAHFLYLPYAQRKIEKQEQEQTEEQTENDVNRTSSYIENINHNQNDNNQNDNQNDNNQILEHRPNYENNIELDDYIKDNKKYVMFLEKYKHEKTIEELHENAQDIDPRSEKLCSWIQIITACFSSFAHGSNDVANAIAPLATIYHIYKFNDITKKADVPIWILVIGGIGIVIGLATWGYKIIDRIGRELTKISTSRGFIIELGAALTVIIASRAEIPVSTTHCQVGSVIGCGLVGGIKNIQWKLVKGILFSWFITLPITGCLSALLFSYGYYAPGPRNEFITNTTSF
jgi:solute carrier family 20 (sodium-dependent phosphate transporter)